MSSFNTDPQDWLPHRAPFLLLDTITDLVPGERCEATWQPPLATPFFEGHFPGRPVVPGVLLVESMAQCGAVAVLADPRYAGKLPLFGGIEHARFRRQVAPDELIVLRCEMTQLSARGGKGRGSATVDGRVVAEAELLFVVVDA